MQVFRTAKKVNVQAMDFILRGARGIKHTKIYNKELECYEFNVTAKGKYINKTVLSVIKDLKLYSSCSPDTEKILKKAKLTKVKPVIEKKRLIPHYTKKTEKDYSIENKQGSYFLYFKKELVCRCASRELADSEQKRDIQRNVVYK